MLADIRKLGAALMLGEGGLLKIARDIAGDGALLSLNHMRQEHQEEMLDFLKRAVFAEHRQASKEVFDKMVA